MASLLAEGALGRLRRVESRRYNNGVVLSDTRVHWDLACHDLSILNCLLPDRALDIAACRASHELCGEPSAVSLRLSYPGPCPAYIHVNWIAGEKRRRFVVEGSEGVLVFDDLEPERKMQVRYTGAHDAFVPAIASTKPLRSPVEDFLDCICTGREPKSGGSLGPRTWPRRP